jgi:hypothetical protein
MTEKAMLLGEAEMLSREHWCYSVGGTEWPLREKNLITPI